MYISALYILFSPGSYTSHWLMFFVVNTTGNKAYLILSYLILSPGGGEFPAQMASNAENVSIWWQRHDITWKCKVTRGLSRGDHNQRIERDFVLFIETSLKNMAVRWDVQCHHKSSKKEKDRILTKTNSISWQKQLTILSGIWWHLWLSTK